MTRFICLFLCIIFLFTGSFAQDTSPGNETPMQFSLQQARDYALEHNINVKNTQLDVLIARKKVWETTSLGLPQVNGSASYTNIFEVPEMSFGPYIDWSGMPMGVPVTPEMVLGSYRDSEPIQLGVKENIKWDVTLSQLIFSGEYIVGLQAAKIFKQLSEQNLSKSKLDIIESITQTYFLVVLAEENKNILEKSTANTKQIWEEMKKTNEVGLIDETTVLQLELTYKNLQNTINNINRQVELSYELLKIQMGIPSEQKIVLTDRLESIFVQADIDGLIKTEFNIDNHIDFQLLNTQEKLTQLSLRREKATILPTISAFFMHQEQVNSPDFNFFNPNMLGVSVSLPIFASGQRYVKIQQARLELEKIRNTRELVSQNLEISVMQAKSDLKTAYDKYQNEKENLTLSERIYNDYLAKFREGTVSSLELTQVQNQLLATRGNYLGAMVELLNAKNKLDKALNNY